MSLFQTVGSFGYLLVMNTEVSSDMCMSVLCWVGQKVHSGFSISCYARMQMNSLINPIHEHGIKKPATNGTKDMFKNIILFMRNYEIVTC